MYEKELFFQMFASSTTTNYGTLKVEIPDPSFDSFEEVPDPSFGEVPDPSLEFDELSENHDLGLVSQVQVSTSSQTASHQVPDTSFDEMTENQDPMMRRFTPASSAAGQTGLQDLKNTLNALQGEVNAKEIKTAQQFSKKELQLQMSASSPIGSKIEIPDALEETASNGAVQTGLEELKKGSSALEDELKANMLTKLTESTARNAALENELEESNSKLEKLKGKHQRAMKRHDEMKRSLCSLTDALEDMNKTNDSLVADNKKLAVLLVESQHQRKILEKELQERDEAMVEIAEAKKWQESTITLEEELKDTKHLLTAALKKCFEGREESNRLKKDLELLKKKLHTEESQTLMEQQRAVKQQVEFDSSLPSLTDALEEMKQMNGSLIAQLEEDLKHSKEELGLLKKKVHTEESKTLMEKFVLLTNKLGVRHPLVSKSTFTLLPVIDKMTRFTCMFFLFMWLVAPSNAFGPSTSRAGVPALGGLSATSMMAVPSEVEVAFDQSILITPGNGTIDWNNPVEAVVGGLTLTYFAFSILAGLKYVLKDGWRPKM